MLAGISGTNQGSESPEMRERGQSVHGNSVPGINSSRMKWVLLGVYPTCPFIGTIPLILYIKPFVWG